MNSEDDIHVQSVEKMFFNIFYAFFYKKKQLCQKVLLSFTQFLIMSAWAFPARGGEFVEALAALNRLMIFLLTSEDQTLYKYAIPINIRIYRCHSIGRGQYGDIEQSASSIG